MELGSGAMEVRVLGRSNFAPPLAKSRPWRLDGSIEHQPLIASFAVVALDFVGDEPNCSGKSVDRVEEL
jgi:hypothetical protein